MADKNGTLRFRIRRARGEKEAFEKKQQISMSFAARIIRRRWCYRHTRVFPPCRRRVVSSTGRYRNSLAAGRGTPPRSGAQRLMIFHFTGRVFRRLWCYFPFVRSALHCDQRAFCLRLRMFSGRPFTYLRRQTRHRSSRRGFLLLHAYAILYHEHEISKMTNKQ